MEGSCCTVRTIKVEATACEFEGLALGFCNGKKTKACIACSQVPGGILMCMNDLQLIDFAICVDCVSQVLDHKTRHVITGT